MLLDEGYKNCRKQHAKASSPSLASANFSSFTQQQSAPNNVAQSGLKTSVICG